MGWLQRGLVRRRVYEVFFQPLRERRVGAHLHIADAAHARLDTLDIVCDELGRYLKLDAEHQLLALALRLDLLSRELCFRRNEADLRGSGFVRFVVDGDARRRAGFQRGSLVGWEEDLHINVAQIHESQRLAAGAEDLSRFDQAIEYPSGHGRDQGRILDAAFGPFYLRLVGFELTPINVCSTLCD